MKEFQYIYIAILAFTFMACDPESSFEQVATIDIPEHEPRLAISSNIEAGDTQLQVLVANSSKIFEGTLLTEYPNAQVRLYKNDVLFQNFQYDEASNRYVVDLNEPIPNDGSSYRLEVEEASLGNANSVQIMPNATTIISTDYDRDRNFGDFSSDVLGVTFNDDPNENNYYAIEAFKRLNFNGEIYLERVFLYPLFGLAEEGDNGSIVFDDASFNGNSYKIEAEVASFVEDDLIVQLKSISRDKYLFERSYSLYNESRDNPFAEPVVVHDNIEDGVGIFTVAAVDEVILEL